MARRNCLITKSVKYFINSMYKVKDVCITFAWYKSVDDSFTPSIVDPLNGNYAFSPKSVLKIKPTFGQSICK